MLRRLFTRKQEGNARDGEANLATPVSRAANVGSGNTGKTSADVRLTAEVMTAGDRHTPPPFASLNESEWEDYERFWSWDKEWFESLHTWRKVRRIVHQHWNLDTRLWQVYARREVDGVLPAIKVCEEMIRLAPLAKEALPIDHQIEQEFRKQDQQRHKAEFERMGIIHEGWERPEQEFRMPEHRGFKQLAIIREKEKDFEATIRVCEAALGVDWPGDWDVRIARCRRRLEKKTQKQSTGRKTTPPSFESSFCTQCGASVSPNDVFCAGCGTKIHAR